MNPGKQPRASPHIVRPRLGPGVYIANTAYVGAEVTIGADTTIMHHVMIRGDVAAILIGARCNIQDGSIVHTKTGVPLEIEDEVSVGHRAVVHCRRVGRGSLIGIGAIVLDDAEIGAGCIVGAAALVAPGTIVPPGKVVLGIPARVVREVTDADREYIRHVIENYVRLGRLHAAGAYPNAAPPAQPPAPAGRSDSGP